MAGLLGRGLTTLVSGLSMQKQNAQTATDGCCLTGAFAVDPGQGTIVLANCALKLRRIGASQRWQSGIPRQNCDEFHPVRGNCGNNLSTI
jgi:hypothetical protein